MAIAETTDPDTAALAPPAAAATPDAPRMSTATIVRAVLALAVFGFLSTYVGWGSMGQTLLRVVVAVGLSALLFVAANKLFDQAYPRWVWFNGIVGFLVGLVGFAVVENNDILRRLVDPTTIGDSTYDLNPWLWGVIGGAVTAAAMVALAAPRDQLARLPLAVAGFAVVGLVAYFAVRDEYQPGIDPAKAAICAGAGAGVFALYRVARGPAAMTGQTAITGGVIGAAIGLWGGADLGAGSKAELLVATVGLGAALGVRVGLGTEMTAVRRRNVDQRSRAWIFLTPALAFITGGLLLPLVRNAWLSFRDGNGANPVGWGNYRTIFDSPNSWDWSNWSNFYTSRLFFIAVGFVLLAVLAGLIIGSMNRSTFETGGAPRGLAFAGFFFLAIALLSSVRGTIANNIWWVVVVVTLATVLGLAVAVLADRSRGENLAKSLIFVPMAISFVGAGVIWRFMYLARPPSKNQTGVMNSIWVFIGELSIGNSIGHWAVIAVGVGLIALLAVLAGQGLADRKGLMGGVSIGVILLIAYLLYLFHFHTLGGVTTNSRGVVRGEPILFTEDNPFNNMWLMVVLIWIQTGFAMVIFSSAIKGVPAELTEAAKVDGATESQVFWKITIPQIAPTIGVVVTTLIVTVMKVFDIVKVMTGGINGTQVIANDMISNAFANSNFGLGAALAMLLFVAVLPVMFVNIRRMQKAKV